MWPEPETELGILCPIIIITHNIKKDKNIFITAMKRFFSIIILAFSNAESSINIKGVHKVNSKEMLLQSY